MTAIPTQFSILKLVPALCGVAVLICGCGGTPAREAPSNLVPISGSVKLNGEPVEGIKLGFIPQGDTPGAGAWAVTDASGSFTVNHMNGGEGIEPGTYQVSFSLMRLPDGDPIPMGVSPTDMGAVEALPHLANPTPDNKQYVVTFTKPMSDLNYDLKE